MFRDSPVNKRINKIHERAHTIAFMDGCSSFEELLRKAESVSIHQRNVKLLATDIFETQSYLNPSFMKQILILNDVVVVVVYFILSRLLFLAFSANLGLLCMPHPGIGPLV